MNTCEGTRLEVSSTKRVSTKYAETKMKKYLEQEEEKKKIAPDVLELLKSIHLELHEYNTQHRS
jgi:methionine salvage enolase-phosphatase E1